MFTLDNFDWSITNRKVVIFCPNWGRGEYIRRTIKEIDTHVPYEDWLVVVINDRIHEDFSDLDGFENTVYLTFGPERTKEGRGDAFMRNIIIKRCQSEWLFQKDPEIIVHGGDFIQHIIDCPTDMYRLTGPAMKVWKDPSLRFLADNDDVDIEDCIAQCDKHPIDKNKFVFFHFGFAVKTEILRNMRGYDEDYKKMYCADRDLYARLMAQGVVPTFDPECKPVHLWHPEPWLPSSSEQNKQNYQEMRSLFDSKDPADFIRNDPDNWGEGD